MNQKTLKTGILGLIVIVFLAAAGCGGGMNAATPTPGIDAALMMEVMQTEYAKLTQTAAAMPTATATPVPPTETPIPPTETATPAAKPTLNFTDVDIYVSFLSGNRTQILIASKTLISVDDISKVKNDYRMVADGKNYVCNIIAQKGLPKLYCVGPKLQTGKYVKIQVFQKDQNDPVFETGVTVPLS